MGMTLGLAMDGNVPISIFPRWNFLLYGMNQLINHIDKFKSMNGQKLTSRIIIRTGIGSQRPLHPQFQHIGDFFKRYKKNVHFYRSNSFKRSKEYFPSLQKSIF